VVDIPIQDTSIDGCSTPSANHEANDQYNLAMNSSPSKTIFRSAKTFKHAWNWIPFCLARLQHALAIVIELFNGTQNDGTSLYRAEEELHRRTGAARSD